MLFKTSAKIFYIMTEKILKSDLSKEVLQILLVAILFAGGIYFENNDRVSSLKYLTDVVLISAYIIAGSNVLSKAIKNLFKGNFFDENFLMSLATLGALAINELPEAVMVMLLYNVGEFFQKSAVGRSRKSIRSLLEIRPEYANLKVDDKIIKTNPSEVKVNDLIIVKPGEKIPLDGKIINGSSYVDTFILTGESIPKTVSKDDDVLAGMINKSGVIEIKVSRIFGETSISKIMDLVEFAAHKKAKPEKFISKFARIYTPIVVLIAAAIAFLPPLFIPNQSFSDWIYRSLVILVVSCPCALVISIPLTYFGGLGSASRRGILIKGSSYLDTLTELNSVVFDKTGTLTKGIFKVTNVITQNGFSRDEILYYAYLAESNSNHPIADSIREAYGKDLRINEIKEDAEKAIKSLKSLGIKKTIMLSGDNNFTTSKFAQRLNIDSSFSELLPEDKLTKFEEILLEAKGGKVAFVGDGINDAPVIARADLGIAMGGLGSDAAIEAADIVIMEDQPSKVSEAILIARKTRKIVWQNLIFSLAVKWIFILLGVLGVASMWEAVFGDMGVALIAILNATRIFKI